MCINQQQHPMHMRESVSTPAIGDKSGELDSIGNLLQYKTAMFRIFVETDDSANDMDIECSILPAVLPINTLGDALPHMPFDPQTNLAQIPGIITECDRFQIDDRAETDGRCSITPDEITNGSPFREFQAVEEQYNHWQMNFPVIEPGASDSSNTFQSQSPSGCPSYWGPFKFDPPSPEGQLTLDDFGRIDASLPVPDLFHPIPRHSPYMVTGYFASENIPEAMSTFGQTGGPQDHHLYESNGRLMQESDWMNDDSVLQFLPQEGPTPGTTSPATMAENHTPSSIDDTYDNGSVSLWPTLKTQGHWDVQQPSVTQNNHEVVWNGPQVYSDIDPQQDQFCQFTEIDDEINGLPYIGPGFETFAQSSSTLDTYVPTFPNFYLHGDATTLQDFNETPYSNDYFPYQNGLPQINSAGPFFNTFGQISSYQPSYVERLNAWTNDARNALLIEYKRRGLSYRDIKKIGGFREAESTLRGRYRTLTKTKDQRVRRPQWQDNDVRLLCEAVSLYTELDRRSICISTCRSRRPDPGAKIPWKKVAQYISAHGGSYHFGNSTCKKKWCEVQSKPGGDHQAPTDAVIFS